MIDEVGLAAHRLQDARNLLHELTISPNFFILQDSNLIGSTRLRQRHWNLCRSLAAPENSMLLANEAAYTAIWKEIHNQPMIMVGRLHEDWNTTGIRYALSQQLVLSGLNEDGLWRPIHTYSQAVAELLPLADRPSYFVESHFSTSIADALRWMGIGVEPRDHGTAPTAPLTFRDRAIQFVRGGVRSFEVSVFGGEAPYTFAIESQSTAGLFSIAGSTLSVDTTLLTQAAGLEHSVLLEVTDARSRTDTGTWTLTSGT